jgi:hypothetical protein
MVYIKKKSRVVSTYKRKEKKQHTLKQVINLRVNKKKENTTSKKKL